MPAAALRLICVTAASLALAACAAPATPIPSSPAPASPAAVVAAIPIAGGPIGLAATDQMLWVEDHRANLVSQIDPAKNIELNRLSDVNVHCDIAAGAGFVWTAQASVSQVNKVDPTSGDVLRTLSLSEACGVTADDKDLWITSPGLGKLLRYDPQTLEERASITLAKDVFDSAIGPEAVWVGGESGGGTLYRVDPMTNALVTSISLDSPVFSGVAVGHGAVWVPSRENKVVYRIDPATNAVVATIAMPSAIGGLGVGPDAIWTSGFGDGKVYRIDPATNHIVASVSTGQNTLGPPLFAFDSIWVAGLDKNVVLRIDPALVK